MTQPHPGALPLTRTVLRGLMVLNLVMGALILFLLIASLVAEGPVGRALGVHHAPGDMVPIRGMELVMVVGLLAVPLTQVILRRLVDMVDTVRAGDPFVHVNALRLRTIAWSLLGLEVLHLLLGAVLYLTASHGLHLDWTFSLTNWLAVLLLFVLANVFEQGAGMRDELAGTV